MTRRLNRKEFEAEYGEDELEMPVSTEYEKIANLSGRERVNDRVEAVERIKEMWDSFNLEEYMAYEDRLQRDRSSSTGARGSQGPELLPSKSPTWRHRVTVPRPFSMTSKDETRSKNKQALEEATRKIRIQQQVEDEAKLAAMRRFKANPIPAHVFMPIYDDLTRSQLERRRFVEEHAKELLRTLQKPFKFSEGGLRNRHVERCLPDSEEQAETKFKANPIPASTYDHAILEKYDEDQLYRKIQSRIRAIEQYKKASLPPSMEARRKAQQQLLVNVLKQKADDVVERKETANRAKRAAQIEQERLRNRSLHYEAVPPPVVFPERNEVEIAPQRRRNSMSGADASLLMGRLAASSDRAPPTRLTSAAQLRLTIAEQRAAAELTEMEQRRTGEEDRALRYQKMVELVKDKTAQVDAMRSKSANRPSSDLVERDREYRKHLDDMKKRVADRPLLLERDAIQRARHQAAARYREALQRVGLTEEEILQSTVLSYTKSGSGTSQLFNDDHVRENAELSPISARSVADDYAQ